MNIKMKPFLIGSSISIFLLLMINVVSTLVTQANSQNILDSMQDPNSNILMITSLITLMSCLCGIGSIFLGAGAYAYLHNKESAIDIQDGAVGGGAVGALSYMVASIIGMIISFAFVLPNTLASAGMPADMPAEVGTAMAVGGVIGGIMGLCISVFLGGGVGAVSGAATAALLNRE